MKYYVPSRIPYAVLDMNSIWEEYTLQWWMLCEWPSGLKESGGTEMLARTLNILHKRGH